MGGEYPALRRNTEGGKKKGLGDDWNIPKEILSRK